MTPNSDDDIEWLGTFASYEDFAQRLDAIKRERDMERWLLDKLTPAQLQRLWDDIWFGVEASKPAPTRSALSKTEGDLGFFDLDAICVLEDL